MWACSAPLDVCIARALVQCLAAVTAEAHTHMDQQLDVTNAPVITLLVFLLFVQQAQTHALQL